MSDFSYIKHNLDAVREQMESAARLVGVPVPTLAAVTKSATDEELVALVRYGAENIAENRPQELTRRAALLKEQDLSVCYHQIGHLQSNKAAKVLPLSPLIHSLGSESLLRELERLGERDGTRSRVLIEVNSAAEESKSGVHPSEVLAFYEKTLLCPHVEVLGLMTMGPVCEDAREIRPYFRLTKQLLDTIWERYRPEAEPILSMGMSDSYRIAIEEGSTLVRIGRRLFVK